MGWAFRRESNPIEPTEACSADGSFSLTYAFHRLAVQANYKMRGLCLADTDLDDDDAVDGWVNMKWKWWCIGELTYTKGSLNWINLYFRELQLIILHFSFLIIYQLFLIEFFLFLFFFVACYHFGYIHTFRNG